jgi:hypothetical protein
MQTSGKTCREIANHIPVIASHPVGAKRRRMTGSAKQSIVTSYAERWIASLRSQ